MKNLLTKYINNFLDRFLGLRIQPSAERRLASVRAEIIRKTGVSLVYDVGANKGQWAKAIRKEGYDHELISFEPSDAYVSLKKLAARDKEWICENLALSNVEGEVNLFSASNENLSTSILEPQEILNQGFEIDFSSGKKALATSLDLYRGEKERRKFYLKLDVQGAEALVLEGAKSSLKDCVAIEFESSLLRLYRGESSHYDLAMYLISQNFSPAQIVITHWDKDLHTVSMDSIFVKADLLQGLFI